MDADKKAMMARILGYICLTVGGLNLTLASVQMAQDRTLSGSPLLVTGISALAGGIIMVALGRQKPTP